MTVTSAAIHDPKSRARSRVTNHKDLLPNIDGRSIVARRYRDIVSAIITDQGGLDRMAEARLQLVRRFAACAVLAEAQEARMVNGEALDIAEYATLTSTMPGPSPTTSAPRAWSGCCAWSAGWGPRAPAPAHCPVGARSARREWPAAAPDAVEVRRHDHHRHPTTTPPSMGRRPARA
jgi:hypothetical protein